MILKYLLITAATVILVTASDPFFGTELTHKPIPKEQKGDVRERPWMATDAFESYLLDSDNRVADVFDVSPFYYPNVNFWFMIYTQFESNTVVIHDKNNLSLIYKVLDFSSLHHKKLPKNTLYVLQQKISIEKMDDLKKDLEELIKDPFSLSPMAKRMYRLIKLANIQMPINKKERVQFFRKLQDNIRTQTGQKDFIRDGVVRSLPYQKFIQRYFDSHGIPSELFSIPFLESSFNPKAESKVNALGVWQFMPLIASYYVPTKGHADYRSNVGVASLSAGFLLKENFKIMKRWDLAVTAYNSGTKHLLKTKRELDSKDVTLEKIIRHSDSAHFGFASKNFYSEFLALAHTLAYREELFDDLHVSDRHDVDEELKFYLLKCSLKLKSTLKEAELDDVIYHNHQLRNLNDSLPKGYILTTKAVLPKGKFYQIPYEKLLKYKPKDWDRFLSNQSCSTR